MKGSKKGSGEKRDKNGDIVVVIDEKVLDELVPKTKPKPKKKKSNKSAADMVSTKTTAVDPKQDKIWTEQEIARMSIAEFDKYEEEIGKAIHEGRVVKQ